MKQEEKFTDLSLLGCDSVSGEWFIMIWRIVLPSCARIRQEPRTSNSTASHHGRSESSGAYVRGLEL